MTDKTKEEMQRIWDTYLLQTWRSAGTVLDAILSFQRETGEKILESNLLRIPPVGYPWKTGMRVFVAQRLEKIGNRMWDMPKDRDAALIDKLQTSKYDTANQNVRPDRELEKEQRDTKKNKAKITLETKNYKNRNQKTDWGTVK